MITRAITGTKPPKVVELQLCRFGETGGRTSTRRCACEQGEATLCGFGPLTLRITFAFECAKPDHLVTVRSSMSPVFFTVETHYATEQPTTISPTGRHILTASHPRCPLTP